MMRSAAASYLMAIATNFFLLAKTDLLWSKDEVRHILMEITLQFLR